MKNEINRALVAKKEKQKIDWSKVLKVVIKILTIGLYHVKKHRSKDGAPADL